MVVTGDDIDILPDQSGWSVSSAAIGASSNDGNGR